MTQPTLTVELIPETSFFKNVRSHVTQREWDKIRESVFKAAGHRCEICNGQGKKHPVECHEIWEYNNNIQKLIGLIALCPSCHLVKHFGLAQVLGKSKTAYKHLKKVNKWDDQTTDLHIQNAFSLWEERNLVKWELDLTYLENYEY